MIQKICFSCAEKTQKLNNGKCLKCILKDINILENSKMPNFKICNVTGKIFYKNIYHDKEDIENMLPNILKKNIKSKDLNLTNFEIRNFEISGHKMIFDLDINIDLK